MAKANPPSAPGTGDQGESGGVIHPSDCFYCIGTLPTNYVGKPNSKKFGSPKCRDALWSTLRSLAMHGLDLGVFGVLQVKNALRDLRGVAESNMTDAEKQMAAREIFVALVSDDVRVTKPST